jgi:hypothetical protein
VCSSNILKLTFFARVEAEGIAFQLHFDGKSAMVALSVGCGSGFDPNPVIHSAVDALLASEVFLGCLHGNVPK